jgi:hypothetical protein
MSDDLNISCKVCGKTFSTERSLHAHLKAHQITQAEYYCRHYPRFNRLTGEPLPFKNKFDYFNKDFSTYPQLLEWCEIAPNEEVGPYILKQLKNRIKEKQLEYAPCHLELTQRELPPIDIYKKIFGSYSAACEAAEVEPIYNKQIKKQFFASSEKFNHLNIFIDTREQQPLKFANSESLKLDFGDYTLGGDNYNYTYVDRKSESDFKSTMSTGFNRFCAEMDRAQQFQSFLYIVIESDLEKIEKNNNYGHRSNLGFIYHNMRKIIRRYPRRCQFIFTGSRSKSEEIIPKLLFFGDKIWQSDIQYYIEKYGISCEI